MQIVNRAHLTIFYTSNIHIKNIEYKTAFENLKELFPISWQGMQGPSGMIKGWALFV